MTIKIYKVKMLVEKEMAVTIDDSIVNDKWFEDFSSYMFYIDSPEDLCEHIGHNVMFNGTDFVEGVGQLGAYTPKENMKDMGVSISRVDEIAEEFEVEEVK